MKKFTKGFIATGLISIMLTGTAFAGTWQANQYQTPQNNTNEYSTEQTSYKAYNGFNDDRTQAVLVDTNWRYQKDDGTYAASEWIQDEAGKYYYIGASGTTAQGYESEGSIDGNAYFFEPSDGSMLSDTILGVDSVGGWDVDYTVNADGTWDFKPWDGFNLASYQENYYLYFGENGGRVRNGAIPGGNAADGVIQNVTRGIDENGIPFVTVGDVLYIAVKSSSLDSTSKDLMPVDGVYAKSASHQFYTVYKRQK